MVKEIEDAIFSGDQQIDEAIIVTGTLKIEGSLKALSLKVKGNIIIEGYIECEELIDVRGTITSTDKIMSKKVIVDGEIIARGLEAKEIKLAGKIAVEENIMGEKVYLAFNSKRNEGLIGGVIKGKKITIRMRESFTKWSLVPGKILKRLNVKKVYKKNYTIENLHIEAEELILSTLYPPKEVEFTLKNCTINVKRREIVQIENSIPRPKIKLGK